VRAATAGATATELLPLRGFTVGVTAARRHEELARLLQRRGAQVVGAPAIRLVPLADDTELLATTRACLDADVDLVVATTGIGFRGWMEVAAGWGLGERLHQKLAAAEIIARGPKATGAIRAAGLTETWSPPSESMSGVLEHLLGYDLTSRRVVVQLHGEPLLDIADALSAAGADVLTIPVYRWTVADDVAAIERLVELVIAGQVDALTFTSAPAVLALLQVAEQAGRREQVLRMLRAEVVAACVGPVCSAPLERFGVPCVLPDRARLGNLVRTVVEEVPARRTSRLTVAGHDLEIRGQLAVLDGVPVSLPPGPMAVLRALARHPGRVCSRADLAPLLPGTDVTPHAVEMAVTRLRAQLGQRRLVQTVVKRGYRLALDWTCADHTPASRREDGRR
jgi:uroporphyrinogen-III synthase